MNARAGVSASRRVANTALHHTPAPHRQAAAPPAHPAQPVAPSHSPELLRNGPTQGRPSQDHPDGGGPRPALGSCGIQDNEDEQYYAFDYREIVTEGLRTIRTDERVRFHASIESPDAVEFVSCLDQPHPAEYYR